MFNTKVAVLEHKLMEVEQRVVGGVVEVGRFSFRSRADADLFAEGFPDEEVYHCFLSFSGLVQRVSRGIKSVEALQADETHEYRVHRNERKTKVINSFATKYPSVLGKDTPFSALKSVDEWTNYDKTGFADLLEETMRNEREAFPGQVAVLLENHPEQITFCEKLFEHACAWITWFLAEFKQYYEDLVHKASLGKTATPAVKKQCWGHVVKCLKVLFDELYKARAGAQAAHRVSNRRKQTALFLHFTLQEVRVLDEFKATEWKKHPKILANLTEHLVETYQPRDSSGNS